MGGGGGRGIADGGGGVLLRGGGGVEQSLGGPEPTHHITELKGEEKTPRETEQGGVFRLLTIEFRFTVVTITLKAIAEIDIVAFIMKVLCLN